MIDEIKKLENQIQLASICENKNNINSNISNCRNTYLNLENEYIYEELQKSEVRDYIKVFNHIPPEELYEEAIDLIYQVENNLVPPDGMDKIELKLLILLGSIQDKKIEEEYMKFYKNKTLHK